MVDFIKFSQMTSGGDIGTDAKTPGLSSGLNVLYNNPWTFLAPGPTGDRPIPAAPMYYRLRFNTTLEVYEYYDPTTLTWTQLSGTGTGTVNPGVANDIAFYAANGQAVSPVAGLANAVLISNGSKVPSMSTTLPSGLTLPGATITGSTAALTAGSVIAAPVSGNDLVNKTYADSLFGSGVQSLTGTTNQITFSSPTGNITASLPQDIALGSTPTFAGLTLSSIPLGGASGGTGINNSTRTITIAGNLQTVGAFNSVFTMTGATGVTFPTSGTLATTSQIPTGAALTKTDDTNVTLSLGGSPTTALVNPASLTLGWTGQLSGTRGGTGVNNGANTITVGGNLSTAAAHTLSGAFASTFTFTGITGVTFPTTGTLATTSQIPSGAALTKTDDTNVTLTLGGSPTTALVNAASLALGWTGQLSIARGGTGVSSVTISPTASAWAGWDANSNLSAKNHLSGFSTTATAAANTTLTVASNYIQEFTGSTTQTVTLPVASTLAVGQSFYIINNSSGNVTINSSGSNAILVMAANTTAFVTCVLASGTSAASWNASYVFDAGAGVLSITGTANQVIASASTGNVTLSLPQDIATSSTPAFANARSAYSSITSAAGTTTLTVSSNYFQQVVGSTTQTIQMPVTSTLITGQSWQIINNSTGAVTINSSGSNLIISLASNTSAIVTCISTSGTTAASWTTSFSTSGGGSGIVDAWVQYTPTFTSFGTPTSVNIWSRRVGGNLEVRGSFATGTMTATEARITLGYQGTNANVTMSGTVVNSQNQVIGNLVQGVAAALSIYILGIASSGYFTIGVQSGTRVGLTNIIGSDIFNNGQAVTFMMSVPITGWS